MRKTRSKKNSFNWNKVQRFSIRKLSFGVASCMIGAHFVLSGLSNPVEAALKLYRDQQGGNVTTLYSNKGDTPEDAPDNSVRGKVNVDQEIDIKVDWSQYSKTTPYVTVTYKYNGGFGGNAVAHYSGRPDFWFTTPIGLKEPKEITLYNGNTGEAGRVMNSWSETNNWVSGSNSVGSRYQSAEMAQKLGKGDPTKWERYNDQTGESGRTFRGDLDGMFWWRIGSVEGSVTDKGIYETFKNNTKSMYSDWEKMAHQSVTIKATYEVVDPTLKNGINTLDFGAGVKTGRGLSFLSHFKVSTVEVPVLYKDAEFFEPIVPERLGVKNPDQLSELEKTIVKERILKANQNNSNDSLPEGQKKFLENLKNGNDGISIGTDGTATITYLDGSTDTIPGGALVYEDINAEEHQMINNNGYSYYKSPYPVADLDNIGSEEEAKGIEKFKEINGIVTDSNGVIQSVREGVSKNFIGKILIPYSKAVSTPNENELPITKFQYINIFNANRSKTGVTIPKEDLFKKKTTLEEQQAEVARQKAIATIDQLKYLSKKEKEIFKDKLNNKNTQEDINNVVNEAIGRNSKNEKGIESKKRDVKKAIDALKYLTEKEKEALRNRVDQQGIEDPENPDGSDGKALEHTKGVLDGILTEAEGTNLTNAKTNANEQIDSIIESLTPDQVNDYKRRIGEATTVEQVEAIVKEAENQKSTNEAQKAQAEAEKLKNEYKKKIDQIPGLSNEDKEKYKSDIDNATSKNQLDNIVEDAQAKATRDTAITTIENLPHLNKAQKNRFKDLVNETSDKTRIDGIVDEAKDLDKKMEILQDLVTKANDVKVSDKYNNADKKKQDAFDNARTAASTVADKETEVPENAATTEEVAALTDKLAKAIEALGETVKVPVSKDSLKDEIDKSEAVKKSVAYTKEQDADKKTAYDKALNKANEVYNSDDAKQADVDNALANLKKAREDLSGKVEDFTLSLKTTDSVKISKEPTEGEELSVEDKALVKANVKANEKDLADDENIEYGKITDKQGKKYVKVTVTRGDISREIDVEVAKKEQDADKATPTVTNGKVAISVDPATTPTVTDQTDKDAIINAVTVPQGQPQPKSKDFANGGNIETGTGDNDGKKVVKVKVTYEDNSEDVIEVPVEKKTTIPDAPAGQKDADKATPTVTNGKVAISVDPATTPTVTDQTDKDAIINAVTVPQGQPQPKSKDFANGGNIETGTGDNDGKKVVKVKVTYNDNSEDVIEVPVEKKATSAGGQGGSGSQGNQNGQGGSGSQGGQSGQGGSGSQGNQSGQGGSSSQGGQSGQGGSSSQGDQNGQSSSDSTPALANARKAAENILDEAERAKKAQLEEAGLSADEKAELSAKVDAEKQAALDEIAKAKDVETVKQLVTKAVAKIKAIQPSRNSQDNQDSQDAQNVQEAQNHSNSNPTSLAANVRGQELPATGTGNEFVVFNAAAISILTGLGLAIPSKKKETEEK